MDLSPFYFKTCFLLCYFLLIKLDFFNVITFNEQFEFSFFFLQCFLFITYFSAPTVCSLKFLLVYLTLLTDVCTSLVVQLVKNLSVMQETWVQSLGWKDLLEKGIATHSSILAWRIPWTVQSMGLQKVRCLLYNLHQ